MHLPIPSLPSSFSGRRNKEALSQAPNRCRVRSALNNLLFRLLKNLTCNAQFNLSLSIYYPISHSKTCAIASSRTNLSKINGKPLLAPLSLLPVHPPFSAPLLNTPDTAKPYPGTFRRSLLRRLAFRKKAHHRLRSQPSLGGLNNLAELSGESTDSFIDFSLTSLSFDSAVARLIGSEESLETRLKNP
jgi:hypothetical protein